MTYQIAVVEDDPLVRKAIVRALSSAHCYVATYECGEEFLGLEDGNQEISEQHLESADLVLLDFFMGKGKLNGLDVLKSVHERRPHIPVVMLTAYGDVDLAVEAMKAGASEFLQKPVSVELLETVIKRHARVRAVERENLLLKEELNLIVGEVELIGNSAPMQQLMEKVRRVSASDVKAILIHGETGTGKEIVARLLHFLSSRRDKPFVPINSGAVMPSLLESEMFGYTAGAFTGANPGGRTGRIEFADGGTVFLDEIGDMPLALQVKLLRTLESGEVRPVGANEERIVDVRFLAATHQDLRKLVKQERFRIDLYHRLSVIVLEVPPLRTRAGDIQLLAEHFLGQFSRDLGAEPPKLSDEALRWMRKYRWPGNVRELRNLMERVALLVPGSAVNVDLLAADGGIGSLSSDEHAPPSRLVSDGAMVNLDDLTLVELERKAIERAMQRADDNVAGAARLLGLGYGALRHRIKRLK